ncbi:MAG TPA: CBS domain-containing protein [Dehalococcoidales bacterium]|nr:CBS domain-containing protein [Dehalococcoidales bacterium]
MYIREYMVTPVITVTPDTLIDDALRTMHQHHIRRLPVVDEGKLVGLLTRNGLREATPSSAIPLSIWGTHYQLSKMKVRDVMITDVITVTPDTSVEEASALVEKHRIGTLPVIDESKNLVGIITSTDLLHLMAQVLGFGQKGVRLHIFGCSGGTEGVCHRRVMEVLSKHPIEILSAFPVKLADTEREDFIVHLDTEDAEPIVNELKKLGLEVEVRKH